MLLTFQVLTLYFSFLWLISKCWQGWPGPLYNRQGWVTECYGILSTWNKPSVRTIYSPTASLCPLMIFKHILQYFLQCHWKIQNSKSISNDPSTALKKKLLCLGAGICKSKWEKEASLYPQHWVKDRFGKKNRCYMQHIILAISIQFRLLIIRSYQKFCKEKWIICMPLTASIQHWLFTLYHPASMMNLLT